MLLLPVLALVLTLVETLAQLEIVKSLEGKGRAIAGTTKAKTKAPAPTKAAIFFIYLFTPFLSTPSHSPEWRGKILIKNQNSFGWAENKKTSTIYAGFINDKYDKELFFLFICLP
jgi:hypothetical protein